ncbi:MAG: hypothetical protein JO257_33010 [Deltaproteobacteria bacterium]|nr:hypothetical protein [Deltaproteobacteria bacterium]
MRTVALLVILAACSKDDAGGSGSAAPITGSAATGSAAKKGSGFSASLSAELAKEGSAAPSVPLNAAPPAGAPPAGSAATAAGSAATAAGSAPAAPAGTTTTMPSAPGSAAVAMTGSAAKPAATTTSPPAPAAGSAVATTKPTTTTTTAPTPPSPPPTSSPTSRVPVKPPPELAAIKIDLEPNWVRDVGEAGTISFVLNVPNTTDTRVFSFHYGYDAAGAPDDRDAYMKWLADNKLLSVSLNRQRGAAWYLEGSDGSGTPAFRTLVLYGGKHLVCWGTLYKDAASNSLGDLRDKVVMTAKQICGTLAL